MILPKAPERYEWQDQDRLRNSLELYLAGIENRITGGVGTLLIPPVIIGTDPDPTSTAILRVGGGIMGTTITIPTTTSTVALTWGGLAPSTTKGRLNASSTDNFQFTTNRDGLGVQDDVTKPSWVQRWGAGLDSWFLERYAPGGALTSFLNVKSTGETDVLVGPLIVGTDPGGSEALRIGGKIKSYFSGAVADPGAIVSIADSPTGGSISTNFTAFACGATLDPAYVTVRTRGTYAAPTPVLLDDVLGTFSVAAQYDTTQFHASAAAGFLFRAGENHSATNRGSYLTLWVTPLGTATAINTYRWDPTAYTPTTASGVTLGSASKPWGAAWMGAMLINNAASDNQLILDNTGQQYTTAYWKNNGTSKFAVTWDQTNTLARLGTTANASVYFASNAADRWQLDTSGNLLASTTNGGYLAYRPGSAATTAKAPGVLFESNNATTTSTTTATITGGSNGGTYTLKANTLSANGDTLRIVYNVHISATTGTITLTVGGSTVIAAVALSSNGSASLIVWITRRDATHFDWTYEGAHFNAANTLDLNRADNVNVDLTTDQTINFQGSAASGTLTAHLCQIVHEAA